MKILNKWQIFRRVLAFVVLIPLIMSSITAYAEEINDFPELTEEGFDASSYKYIPSGKEPLEFIWPNDNGRYSVTYDKAVENQNYVYYIIEGYCDSLENLSKEDFSKRLIYINEVTAESDSISLSEISPSKECEATMFISGTRLKPEIIGYISDSYFSLTRYSFLAGGDTIPLEYCVEEGVSLDEIEALLPAQGYAEIVSRYKETHYVPVTFLWDLEDITDTSEVGNKFNIEGKVFVKEDFENSFGNLLSAINATVEVVDSESTPTELYATKGKISYSINEPIELDDVYVNALFSDGTVRSVEGWSSNISTLSTSAEGYVELVISYVGLSTSIELVVHSNENRKLIVSFDSNGGSFIAPMFVEDKLESYPTAPTKKGYRFAGWYTDTALTEEYEIGSLISQDITLHAKWISDDVTYPVNMEISLDRKTIAQGEEWKDSFISAYVLFSDGSTKEIKNFTTNSADIDFSTIGVKNISIYAYVQGVPLVQFASFEVVNSTATKMYHVDFISNCDEFVETQHVIQGGKATEPIGLIKEGYVLAGWFDGSKKWDFNKNISKDITLTAQWVLASEFEISDQPFVVYVQDELKYTYTGSKVTPNTIVMDLNGNLLKNNTDYKVTYSNNKSVTDVNPALMTVTGKGNYSGKAVIPFIIEKKDLDDEVTCSLSTTFKFSSKGINPSPSLKYKKLKLKKDTDFTVSYYKLGVAGDVEKEVDLPITVPGKYRVIVSGEGNYSGEKSIDILYAGKELYNLSGAKITVNFKGSLPYSGMENRIDDRIVVSNSKTKEKYVLGEDYTIEYPEDCTNPGTIKVTINAVDGSSKVYGSKTYSYKISGISISGTSVKLKKSSLVYDGEFVNDNINKVTLKVSKSNAMLLNSISEQPLSVGDFYSLVQGEDYDVSYSNNLNQGKTTVSLEGKGLFYGNVKKIFTISKKSISDADITVAVENAVQNKAGIIPSVKVKRIVDGRTVILKSGVDYSLKGKSNTSTGSKAKVEITGIGNYKGKVTRSFVITSKGLESAGINVVADNLVEKTGTKSTYVYKPSITVYDGNKPLSSSKDYSIDYSGCLTTKDISEGKRNGYITIIGKGKDYTGSIKVDYYVSQYDISKKQCEISIEKQMYKGSAITFDFDNYEDRDYFTAIYKIGGEEIELVPGRDFYIKSYKSNVKAGTCTLTLCGKGKYSGKRTVKFTISKCPIGK